MLGASLASSSVETYKRAWTVFHDFSYSMCGQIIAPPLSVATVSLFVAYLHNLHLSHKTITTYLSAIAYVHKIQGYYDPTSAFVISKLIRGAQQLAPSYDLRLPITVSVLDKLVSAIAHTAKSTFYQALFKAMYLFAFNTFARIGEITSTSANSVRNIIQFHDVDIINTDNSPTSITVTFRHYKHSKGKPHVISFSHGYTKVSPIQANMEYLAYRGRYPGPFFTLPNGQPVPRSLFDDQLRKSLQFCGLDSSRYKSHSFRIGKATDCALRGLSDAYICSAGRWNSNSFRKYIRVNS